MYRWAGCTSALDHDPDPGRALRAGEDRPTAHRKPDWHRCGRRPRRWGRRCKHLSHHAPYRRQSRPSLRPVSRAPGMRAPRNTNQFLMHEKYQMMHLRSDSVGADSGSDCEMDVADMDSYLGMLENARGALMDSPDPRPPSTRLLQIQPFALSLKEMHQEESMQYFPSEDDVMQSEDFMQRDFIDFCDRITSVVPYAM